ncbi:alpha/beta hydrolase [Aquimarina sp. AU474]|uniref:alpha/beta hydrolase n=1 Tax=Aquimarina sp. AU474 TaxID=2108529 RepID=UPI000D69015E|nr:alpha/beta fold hydrolase [Aquimarina sp. AU474]
MRKLKKIMFWIISIYAVILLTLYLFQEKILFQPEILPVDYVYQFDQPFKEVFLKTNDGSLLNGLHFTNKNTKGVILYFHGNRGSLKRWGEIASYFALKQYDIVIMDYRSYGKSTGKITEQILYDDAQLFYNYVLDKYPKQRIIIYGRSLGTGIATKVASENNPAALVLETPYFNMKDVSESWLPYVPTGILLKYKIPSNEFIQKVKCNITIYHGTADKVVPLASGKRLYESISIPNKKMITIPKGSHNNLIQFEEYQSTIETTLSN